MSSTPTPRAEFNIWADSLAAEMVFKTDVPITMIPLDARPTPFR